MKKKNKKKTKRFNLLMTEEEYKKIKRLADFIAEGNISNFLRHAALSLDGVQGWKK